MPLTCCPTARGGMRLGQARSSTTCSGTACRTPTTADDGHLRRNVRRQATGSPEALRTHSPERQARAGRAVERAHFAGEIVAGHGQGRKGETVVDRTRSRRVATVHKIPMLSPAFGDGTVTAASFRSKISDGAAALVVMTADQAQRSRLAAAGAHRRPCHTFPGPGMVHDRTVEGHREGVGQGRLEGRRRRPVRDQRGLRMRGDGAMQDLGIDHATS
jgi:hypothetical protein